MYNGKMKLLRLLLLLLLFLGGATASAVPQSCCDMEECAVAQCVDMGCLSAAAPTAPGTTRVAGIWTAANDQPKYRGGRIPLVIEEVWTPPE
jgi:hypothetical protein